MYDAFVCASLGLAILLDVAFVGGSILAIIEVLHDNFYKDID